MQDAARSASLRTCLSRCGLCVGLPAVGDYDDVDGVYQYCVLVCLLLAIMMILTVGDYDDYGVSTCCLLLADVECGEVN